MPQQRPLPVGWSGCSVYYWIIAALLLTYAASFFVNELSGSATEISWTQFQQLLVHQGQVEKVVVVNKASAEIYVRKGAAALPGLPEADPESSGPHYQMTIGSVESLETLLRASQEGLPLDQQIAVNYVERTDWFGNIFVWLLPFLLIAVLWIFILGRANPANMANRSAMDFGKVSATPFEKSTSSITFDDVAGMEEVKVEVREIVDFLKNQSKYTRLGAKIPKGVILIGPPGTGKTLLAKAVAGEASVPFFSMSGSEFVEMFVGVGASRVRDLFKKAKEAAPSIIFLDEIDAIGQSRGKVTSFRTNDERESTLNQLLAEMDGFEANAGVIVLAATNRAEILDRALMRAGRFDRQIFLNLPTLTERLQIFGVHTRKLLMAPDIDLQLLSRQTPGFSGADIANICNEAALIAARKSREAIQMADFMEAVDRIIGGLERKSKIVSEKEKRIIAFHEAGHVTSSWFLPHADSLLKVSIIPRGKSLGAAWYLPEEHQVFTRAEFMDKICMALGGRAAEALIFGEISSNALDDLERSTKQAYMMVAYYGLDPQLGNVSYYDSTGQYEQSLHKPYSEATAEKIDAAVQEIIATAYQRAMAILTDHRQQLEQVAAQLLLKETLYQDDLLPILGPKSTKPE
ncbi:MAG: ATP-dependent zinc metalloprotease FtsH [Saprospiraceae bacterium]|nr:ATP-dependent zinc metalloprotease FtsH [Saprospiraceae bacterium]